MLSTLIAIWLASFIFTGVVVELYAPTSNREWKDWRFFVCALGLLIAGPLVFAWLAIIGFLVSPIYIARWMRGFWRWLG